MSRFTFSINQNTTVQVDLSLPHCKIESRENQQSEPCLFGPFHLSRPPFLLLLFSSYYTQLALPPSCSFEYHSTHSSRCDCHTAEYRYTHQAFLGHFIIDQTSQAPGLQV